MVPCSMRALLWASLLHLARAATVSYDFSVGWVRANPDGAFERPTIGINGKWPIPSIEANVGDTIVINVKNDLGNQSTSLHFHGLFMEGENHMDGPSQVTQCPIMPGSSFTYEFTINQPGTYWYHSHTRGQYPDGLRGPLIIHDPKSPFVEQYDKEIVVTLSDWYHDQMQNLIPQFMSKTNPTGAEPVPQAALINEEKNHKISVKPGRTYLFRVINIGAFASHYLWFEGHDLTVVEIDGVYTKPHKTNMIYLSAGQRYSFLVTSKADGGSNFPIVSSMDLSLFDVIPDDLDWNVTGWLVYDDAKSLPKPAFIDEFSPIDDMSLVPYDEMDLLPAPDRSVEFNVIMDDLGDGANYAFFNNITYREPKVPTLYTALTAAGLATNPKIYGDYTNTFVLEKGEVVQVVINNMDSGRHPFHIHGHHFQAVYRSEEDAGVYKESEVPKDAFSATPMRRDTVVVWPNGNVVLRFRATNPGVWVFHCHIEWHVASGLTATFVEAPVELQRTLKIPQNHLDACKAGGVPVSGNAAGNDEDLLDLSGQNSPPARLPEGFTAYGILALVISCISGVTGILVVGWYGMNPVEGQEKAPPSIIADLVEPEDTAVDTDGNVRRRNQTARLNRDADVDPSV
ncbi:Iron transport multicopper oxidase fetC [Paramyrothecium foliicola]|nr:Iron transport multicopper oxidase fetC [Paramyrothecium foliicola]